MSDTRPMGFAMDVTRRVLALGIAQGSDSRAMVFTLYITRRVLALCI